MHVTCHATLLQNQKKSVVELFSASNLTCKKLRLLTGLNVGGEKGNIDFGLVL